MIQKYGKGYYRNNLYHCLRFYKAFPQIVDTLCRQSNIKLSWSHYRTLLQVHDEIVLDVPNEELAVMQTLVKKTMEEAISLSVPLLVDENNGKTWYDAK